MLTCDCGETFETNEEARDHVKDAHAAQCDELLQEYIEDSINDAVQELIHGEE